MNELQMRALRFSMPLAAAAAAAAAAASSSSQTSASVHSSHTPFFPSLPVIEGDFTPPSSPNNLQKQLKILEETAARTTT
ncbi:hypothetical protein BLA29_011955, partial [Euroglyphus maynei]